MAYYTFTNEFLVHIHDNWIAYCNNRIKALNHIYNYACDSFEKQGNKDLNTEVYTFEEVQEWFDNKVIELKKWYKTALKGIKEENILFEELFKIMSSDRFSDDDYHYKITYDFINFKKKKKYDSKCKSDNFDVEFIGQTHWYQYGNEKSVCEFNLSYPVYDLHTS